MISSLPSKASPMPARSRHLYLLLPYLLVFSQTLSHASEVWVDSPPLIWLAFDELTPSSLVVGEQEVANSGSAGGVAKLMTFGEGEITASTAEAGSARSGVNLKKASGKGGSLIEIPLGKITEDFTMGFFFRLHEPDTVPAFSTLVKALDAVDIQVRSVSEDPSARYLWTTAQGRPTRIPLSAIEGGWHHLAITFEKSGGKKAMGRVLLYLDGNPIEVPRGVYASVNPVQPSDSPATITFGGRETGSHFFPAEFDDIMIFSRLLDMDEIWNLAHPQP